MTSDFRGIHGTGTVRLLADRQVPQWLSKPMDVRYCLFYHALETTGWLLVSLSGWSLQKRIGSTFLVVTAGLLMPDTGDEEGHFW